MIQIAEAFIRCDNISYPYFWCLNLLPVNIMNDYLIVSKSFLRDRDYRPNIMLSDEKIEVNHSQAEVRPRTK